MLILIQEEAQCCSRETYMPPITFKVVLLLHATGPTMSEFQILQQAFVSRTVCLVSLALIAFKLNLRKSQSKVCPAGLLLS